MLPPPVCEHQDRAGVTWPCRGPRVNDPGGAVGVAGATVIDSGAARVAAVAKATGACTRCGTCRDRIRAMISDSTPSAPRVSIATSLILG